MAEATAEMREVLDEVRTIIGDRSMGLSWLRIRLDPDHSRLEFWMRAALRRPGKSAG